MYVVYSVKRLERDEKIMMKYFRKKSFSSLFCTSCTASTPESIEKDMNRKIFPRICIGHVGLVIVGITIAVMELMH